MKISKEQLTKISDKSTPSKFMEAFKGGQKACVYTPQGSVKDINIQRNGDNNDQLEIQKFRCIQTVNKHPVKKQGHEYYLTYQAKEMESLLEKAGFQRAALVDNENDNTMKNLIGFVRSAFSKWAPTSDIYELFFTQKHKVCLKLKEEFLPEKDSKIPSELTLFCVKKASEGSLLSDVKHETSSSIYTGMELCSNNRDTKDLLDIIAVDQGEVCSTGMITDILGSDKVSEKGGDL